MIASGSLKVDLPAFSRSDTQYSSGSFSRVNLGRSSPESPSALLRRTDERVVLRGMEHLTRLAVDVSVRIAILIRRYGGMIL